MAEDDRRRSPSVIAPSSLQSSANGLTILGRFGNNRVEASNLDGRTKKSSLRNSALIIREGFQPSLQRANPIEGKGKRVADVQGSPSASQLKGLLPGRFDWEASSSGLKLKVNRFVSATDPTTNLSVDSLNQGSCSSSVLIPYERIIDREPTGLVNNSTFMKKMYSGPEKVETPSFTNGDAGGVNGNPDCLKEVNQSAGIGDSFLTDNGVAVKLHTPNEIANANKLQFVVVAKTSMGSIWSVSSHYCWNRMVLVLFPISEAVLTGGPWFVHGHIIGLDKWSPSFSPSSMKSLTSLVWIRMPQLP
ncbi:hypothetical protein M5K25_008347 [Dendrobium thyrsiflorum]|uniref:DUF4283 domain-containing protein n=1 Tax=Dendrobium thyrsiflorum TaxID=117978 RepID=A0ABD0V8J8_DENTH